MRCSATVTRSCFFSSWGVASHLDANPGASGRDLTSGSLHRDIWYLAIPMILEMGVLNVAQVLDTLWIGKLGSAALAAVIISSSIRWVINSMAAGLGSGGLAFVARRIGERDEAAAAHAAWQTIVLGLAISAAVGALGLLVARPMLILLGADAEVLQLGLSYLRITMVGLFTLVLIFTINALLRGAGEARWATIVLFVATAVTVVTEWVLVFGWGPFPALGIAGSAWGSVLGFGTGLGLQVALLFSGKTRIRLSLRNFRLDLPLMRRIIRISLPNMIQMFLRSSSRLIVLGLIGLYGTFATAGYGVANRLLLIAVIPGFGLGNAAGTLVGQNLGARKPERSERTAWWVSAYAAVYAALIGILLFAFAAPAIALFDPTPEVVAFGAECLRITAPSLLLLMICVVLSQSLVGAGDTVPAMVRYCSDIW